MEADFGEAEKEEFWAVFFKPNVGLMKVKLSLARKDFLSDWLETDDVRYYEILDPEQPKVEHGFFNSRLEKRLPI